MVFFVFSIFLIILYSCSEHSDYVSPLKAKWEKAIPYQNPPHGLSSISAESCGSCHQNHYNEWKISTHRFAWLDQQFQAEIKKDNSPFLCLNCHIPLQNQQEELVHGLINDNIYTPKTTKNLNFDKSLQLEGITCAVCHVRDEQIIGPTGTKKAPHSTKKDSDFLSESLCISCHNASAIITDELVCSFETGDEWINYSRVNKKTCIDCHMPKTYREIVNGHPPRESRFHSFPGSGIPKSDSQNPEVLNGLSIKLKQTSKTVQLGLFRTELVVKNEFAGHNVPTGDPERFIEIAFELFDSKKNALSSLRDTIGERWQWYPVAKKLYDNNLESLKEYAVNFDYNFKSPGIYELRVRVLKHRLNKASAHYNKLDKSYPLCIEIFNETKWIEVY